MIQRWDFWVNYDAPFDPVSKDDKGQYVLYTDHEAELAKLRECVRELVKRGDAVVSHDIDNHIKEPEDMCPSCDSVYGLWRRNAQAALALVGGKEEVGK